MGDQKEDEDGPFRWVKTPRGLVQVYVGKERILYNHTMQGLADGFGMPEATAASTDAPPEKAPK